MDKIAPKSLHANPTDLLEAYEPYIVSSICIYVEQLYPSWKQVKNSMHFHWHAIWFDV